MPRRVEADEPRHKERTDWPLSDRYAREMAKVPRDGEWYEIATFSSPHYAYEVVASLRGSPMRPDRRPFLIPENTRRKDWEFHGTRRRAKLKNRKPGKVLGSAVWVRWVGE